MRCDGGGDRASKENCVNLPAECAKNEDVWGGKSLFFPSRVKVVIIGDNWRAEFRNRHFVIGGGGGPFPHTISVLARPLTPLGKPL